MNKKGFTLIELLSIIVVLAVVAIISIPVVKGIIDNAKKGTLRNSVYGIIDAAGYYYNRNMSEDSELRILLFNDSKQTDDYEKLDYKGTIDHGFVAITPYADVAVCIDNGKWYAKKDISSKDVIVDDGVCTDDFDQDFMGFVTTGTASYIGTRLSVTAYASKESMPKKTGDGYIGIITDTKITNYYFSNDGIEDPKEGNVWIVQNSESDKVIKNDKSKLGVACVMQYEDGKWQPKESYVFNDNEWKLLSDFDDLSGYAWEYDYTGKYETFTAPYSGLYNVELWGAQGGSYSAAYYGGKGAYTAGYLYLDEGESIYIYVGQAGGQPNYSYGGWNGGGSGISKGQGTGYGGGGATDVRTVATSAETTWNELASLNSRIMVAAGGAGASAYNTGTWLAYGAAGGGLEGISAIYAGSDALKRQSSPATQGGGGVANTYYAGYNGGFGYGGNPYTGYSNSGGGSGWYGGSGGAHAGSNNSGGSSYISGHQGCGSVDKNGQANGETVSWTGKYFTNTKMIDGTGYKWTKVKGDYTKMPNKSGSGEVDGNEGNGYAKISLVTPIYKSETTRNKEIAELNTYWSYGAATNYQTFTAPVNGTYRFELWGAQGGSINTYLGGLGAYTKGDIYLEKGTKLYFYVGGPGHYSGGWNGGGNGAIKGSGTGEGGAGATDVRTVSTSPSTTWDEINSLRSRIMVAAGGSGASAYDTGGWLAYGGAGGGLFGLMGFGGSSAYAKKTGSVAGQGIGGIANTTYPGTNGGFGYGGNSYTGYSSNGGGAGWYGGSGGSHAGSVLSGGSSYISGHLGCDSVNENGVHNGSAYSYTGYIFTDTEMIDGEGHEWTIDRKGKVNMKQHLTSEMVAGNSGNGYARVMLVKKETKNNYSENIKEVESIWTYWGAQTYQPFIAPRTGTYKVELWGAQGGTYNASIKGGLGGYTKGEIRLEKGTKLYLFVGTQGASTVAGYNGGGTGMTKGSGLGYGGGGATDIRVLGNELAWNNATSLYSRIMVAGGGGGSSAYNEGAWAAWDGAGGGLEGIMGNGGSDANSKKAQSVASQISGGLTNTTYPGTNGGFGYGGNSSTGYSSNGGAGGWYGGAGGAHAGSIISGGSSYISGHNGCIAVNSSGTPVAQTSSGVEDSYSYTGYKFTSTKMIDGEGYKWTTERGDLIQMPTHDGTTVMTGNEGDGFAKITFVR